VATPPRILCRPAFLLRYSLASVLAFLASSFSPHLVFSPSLFLLTSSEVTSTFGCLSCRHFRSTHSSESDSPSVKTPLPPAPPSEFPSDRVLLCCLSIFFHPTTHDYAPPSRSRQKEQNARFVVTAPHLLIRQFVSSRRVHFFSAGLFLIFILSRI